MAKMKFGKWSSRGVAAALLIVSAAREKELQYRRNMDSDTDTLTAAQASVVADEGHAEGVVGTVHVNVIHRATTRVLLELGTWYARIQPGTGYDIDCTGPINRLPFPTQM